MRTCSVVAGVASLVLAASAVAADEQVERDRAELRTVLKVFKDAFNSRNIEPLTPYLHNSFTVTMVNQDLVTTPKSIKAYLDAQFNGPGALLKDVQIEPAPDGATYFFDGRIGVNRGSSTDTYTLKDGRVFVLKTRWTGTAVKDEGRWKLLNAHIGLNAIDNPILEYHETMKWVWAGAAAAIAFVAGVLGTIFVTRARRPRP